MMKAFKPILGHGEELFKDAYQSISMALRRLSN